MALKEFIQYGHVNQEGKLVIYSQDVFIDKIRKHFIGSSIELVLRERSYHFSNKLRSYYFAVVIREIQKAYLATGVNKSCHDIDYEMRDKFLYYEEVDTDTGEYEKIIHTLRDADTTVTQSMMKQYIEMCIMWTAQALEWVIAYPNEFLEENDMTENQAHANGKSVEKDTSF